MESSIRKPLQGVTNIIRFNWHYYVLSFLIICLAAFLGWYFESFTFVSRLFIALASSATLLSLTVSAYVYDYSSLYKLSWLHFPGTDTQQIVNIHAGFDETSELIAHKFPDATLMVADFYDPSMHTEVSIRRARKAYPVYPLTQCVQTSKLPFHDNSADKVFVIFAAHEIRDKEERVRFFKEVNRIAKTNGTIVITEHLRDIPNFFAYNIGFFHFYSRESWLNIFQQANLQVAKEIKVTAFITTFILKKIAVTS